MHEILEPGALTRDIHVAGLRCGDIGAVVEAHEADAYEVEFLVASGRTQALLTLFESDVRSLGDQDLLSIGGFNTFLAEQVDDAGDVNVTLARMTVSVVAFGREGAFVVLSTVEDAHDGNCAGIFVDRIGDHGSSVVVSKP